tara:strand:- start:41409 stop:43487 length:2079 start_codon:yes stop_codon:yes gene_type:complete
MYRNLNFKFKFGFFILLFIAHGFALSCSDTNALEIDIEATVQARIDEEITNREMIAIQKAEIANSVQATVQAVNEQNKLLLLTPSPVSGIQDSNAKTVESNPNSPTPTTLSVTDLIVAETPEPTPTVIPTVTPTPIPTVTPTPIPTPIPTVTPTHSPNVIEEGNKTYEKAKEVYSVSDVVAIASQSVVRIEIDMGNGKVGIGSGFVIREDGLLVTNSHVVNSNTVAMITLSNGIKKTGQVLVTDKKSDLALIKIDAQNLDTLEFGNSSELLLGQEIIVIGYPKGLVGSATITKGLVSAIRENLFGLNSVIQTDAALNPGNSGGPMLDLSGKVIGVAQAKITDSEGLNLGIPSDEVQPVIANWLKSYDEGNIVVSELKENNELDLLLKNNQGSITGDIYTNSKYWYSVEIPSGWEIDYANPDFVHIFPDNKGFDYESSGLLITSRTIDSDKYPTIESYARDWTIGPGNNVSSFNIDSHLVLPHLYPVQADQYLISYSLGRNYLKKRRDIRYLLGRHVITVTAFAPALNWTSTNNIFNAMISSQNSFDPTSYTNAQYNYSVSYPQHWKKHPSEMIGGYKVADTESSLELRVLIYDNEGYRFISEYAEAKGVAFSDDTSNGKILSKHVAYATRMNPSYRIDYQYEYRGDSIRGASLVTLTDSKAIWVFVKTLSEEWDDLSPIVDQLLIRFLVENQ